LARIEAVVVEQLPSGLYRLSAEGTQQVTAHCAPGAERNFIRLVVGDRVEVELSPKDLTRGRILKRL